MTAANDPAPANDLIPAAGDRQIAAVAAALAALPPAPDPLAAAWEELAAGPLTYRRLLALDDALLPAAAASDRERGRRHEAITQCYRLPPTPLPAVPLGY